MTPSWGLASWVFPVLLLPLDFCHCSSFFFLCFSLTHYRCTFVTYLSVFCPWFDPMFPDQQSASLPTRLSSPAKTDFNNQRDKEDQLEERICCTSTNFGERTLDGRYFCLALSLKNFCCRTVLSVKQHFQILLSVMV